MVPDIDLQKTDPADLQLSWSRGLSLTARILAVNLFVLALFAGGLFFLDSYRGRLIDNREAAATRQATIIKETLPKLGERDRAEFIVNFGRLSQSRIRVFDAEGQKIMDSFDLAAPTYEIHDPDKEAWDKKAARILDKGFDFLVFAPKLATFTEPVKDISTSWPELKQLKSGDVHTLTRLASDFTHIVSAGTWAPPKRVRRFIHYERQRHPLVRACGAFQDRYLFLAGPWYFRTALALFGANDRAAFAPPRPCGCESPARPRAGSDRPPPALAPGRNRDARASAVRYEQRFAAAH